MIVATIALVVIAICHVANVSLHAVAQMEAVRENERRRLQADSSLKNLTAMREAFGQASDALRPHGPVDFGSPGPH